MQARHLIITGFLIIGMFLSQSCKKNDDDNNNNNNVPQLMKFGNAKIGVNFSNISKALKELEFVKQTPDEYIIALKSAKLKGTNGSADFQLFYNSSISDSEVFDFINSNIRHDLGGDTTITEAYYSHFEIELYYLQMRLQIYSINRGLEWRNLRIYYSSDGIHKPGDVTQIDDNGNELGWLFGIGIIPDFDPMTPRTAAYQPNGQWLMFGDKSAEHYGPFGNMTFWTGRQDPFIQDAYFTFQSSSGQDVVMEFNVGGCWQFEDKTGDGYFGGDDVTYDSNPTGWHMEFPLINIKLE